MNHLKFKIYFLLLFITLAGFLFSCKKNDPAPAGPGPQQTTPGQNLGSLNLHLHTYLDGSEIDSYGLLYVNNEGRNFKFNNLEFYLSDFQLVKLDGSIISVPGAIVLKELTTLTYKIADVPQGNYKSIKFKVGLDDATNQQPSAYHPALNNSAMWYGATAQPDGYVYFNVSGLIDTATVPTGNEALMQAFHYKIGTPANAVEVAMQDKNYTVVKGQTEYIHMFVEINKLFQGIALNKPSELRVISKEDNQKPVAATIVNNIKSMFYYED